LGDGEAWHSPDGARAAQLREVNICAFGAGIPGACASPARQAAATCGGRQAAQGESRDALSAIKF
jgi:hypothetical protein